MPDARAAHIRLLVLDIDGTITGDAVTVHERVTTAIRAAREKGVLVAIATARRHRTALAMYETVGSAVPLISYEGALIREPGSGTVHHHLPIDLPLSLRVLEHCERPGWKRQLSLLVYIDDELYVREMNDDVAAFFGRFRAEAFEVGDLRRVLDRAPTKIVILGREREVTAHLDRLRQIFGPTELGLSRQGQLGIAVNHPAIGKAQAVRYLAETLLGLQAGQVMAIGDDEPDIGMLQYAGIGIAMGNAPDPVKTAADWTAPGVDAHGAATAIETWLL